MLLVLALRQSCKLVKMLTLLRPRPRRYSTSSSPSPSHSAKAQWDDALQSATRTFRLLTSQSSSKAWKLVPPPTQPASHASTSAATPTPIGASGSVAQRDRGPARKPSASALISSSAGSSAASSIKGKGTDASASPSLPASEERPRNAPFPAQQGPFTPLPVDPAQVKVHKRSGGKSIGLPSGLDVYRAVVDVPFEGAPDLEPFKAALSTPEARTKWDRMVDDAETIELLDPQTRISKTSFKLGWPASPRDAICISRSISDGNTLIDVSTSLPRSADAPAYLRPAPPYVRSHVHLCAWCIQLPDPEDADSTNALRLTLFWAWDLRGAWLGMPPGGLATHVVSLVAGVIQYARSGSSHLPGLCNYGPSIEVLSTAYDTTRDTLLTEYCVVAEEPAIRDVEAKSPTDAESLAIVRQRRGLATAIEFKLPVEEGWDVKVSVKPQVLHDESSDGWRAIAERERGPTALSSRAILRIEHDRLDSPEESLRAKVTIQRIAASSDIRLRINDENYPIVEVEPSSNDGLASGLNLPVLQATTNLSDISLASTASQDTQDSRSGKTLEPSTLLPTSKRTSAIAAVVRRNYIYFTSMLQEPDAKWKHLSDNRGVTVTQLDSIDPTLVVYRAEATFVGVGVWDIFASISSPGTRSFWDKTLEDTKLLEEVGDVSALWHATTKPSWPVSARDSVMIETSYKSPTSVHIFSFSTDDHKLFPSIPPPASGTIRTQVDLRGWSVEALSPTTVHVTLIEQSDPKGWTSKSATPAAMTAAVAGVGEYAIKVGAPPVLTRILGASVTDAKFDHERASYRLEYGRDEPLDSEGDAAVAEAHNVECELRCDVETWAQSLDLVVDPPPINVSCLRRHKLSPGGGGVWLTIEHDPASLEDDPARVTVRRGSAGAGPATPRERGVVFVNGARMKVDIDELKENELAQLKDRKRTRPQRVPLDRQDKGAALPNTNRDEMTSAVPSRVGTPALGESASAVASRSIDQAQTSSANTPFSDKQPKYPMTPALDVLFLLRRIYAERSPDPAVNPAGWALVSQRNGLYVRRKLMQSISSTVAVQRGDKVVQGLTAEDMVAAVQNLGCRKQWDERVESTRFLESYGDGVTTSFITSAGAFPFRGRGFYLASLTARAGPSSSADDSMSPASSIAAQSVFYHAAASFPEQTSQFDPAQLNPSGLPIGKILLDGWIFETLDPYSSTLNYQIPSTRCTHMVAIDYAGSLPAAVNTMWNANLPRSILAVESFLKDRGAIPAVRAPPTFVQVLGDGRDEDHDFAWVMEPSGVKGKSKLLLSNFSPTDKRLEVLLQALPDRDRGKSEGQYLARTPSVSNASTTKASAQAAASLMPRSSSGFLDHPPAGNGESISRATSTTSMRSGATLLAPTPSTIRTPRISLRGQEPQGARPVVLADVEIELKHFAAGYKIDVFSEFGPLPEHPGPDDEKLDDATPKAEKGPLVLTSSEEPKKQAEKHAISLDKAAKRGRDIPIETTVYDLPPSAVLAATLDPSLRPRRHLLRLSLPADDSKAGDSKGKGSENHATTSAAASDDEDSTDGKWRTQLHERGAVIRVVVRPLRAEPSSGGTAVSDEEAARIKREAEELESQSVPVHCWGQRLEVVHVNKTSAMLQREPSIDPFLSRLRRLPRKSATNTTIGEAPSAEDQIPVALAYPLGLAAEVKPSPAAAVTATAQPSADSAANASSKPPTDEGDKASQSAADSKKEPAQVQKPSKANASLSPKVSPGCNLRIKREKCSRLSYLRQPACFCFTIRRRLRQARQRRI